MYETMQESGLTEIILLICTSAIWDQYPVFSHPESPQGVLSGVAVVADGCNILCLLIWQVAFLVQKVHIIIPVLEELPHSKEK